MQHEISKQEYAAPELTVFGSVEELTAGPRSGWFDAFFGVDGGYRPGGGSGS